MVLAWWSAAVLQDQDWPARRKHTLEQLVQIENMIQRSSTGADLYFQTEVPAASNLVASVQRPSRLNASLVLASVQINISQRKG